MKRINEVNFHSSENKHRGVTEPVLHTSRAWRSSKSVQIPFNRQKGRRFGYLQPKRGIILCANNSIILLGSPIYFKRKQVVQVDIPQANHWHYN